MRERECSLREKKYARTKLGLMNAFMKRLKKHSFNDVSIKEVCRDVEVAEGTFFNYFPEKIDVIGYYLQLLDIKMIWKAGPAVPEGRHLALIDSVFAQLAEELVHTNVVYQILSVFLIHSEKPKKAEISDLEKQLAFPDLKGIENIRTELLSEWLRKCLVAAQKNGELPAKTKVDDVLVSLITILSGTLIATKFGHSKDRGYHYSRQLQALWRGLGIKK